MARSQPRLFEAPPVLPDGFVYRPDFISREEEDALTARLRELPFEPFKFRGYEGRRRVVSFGWRYDFNGPGLTPAEPMPDWLKPVRERAAALAGLPPAAFAHVLINEYREGAPIGWHKDRPVFDRVVGISIGAPCAMRFRRRAGERWERLNARLESRSAYLLAGPARTAWEHSIPEARALRYSVTFRNLRAESCSKRR